MGLLTKAKRKLEENWHASLSKAITKVEGFSDVGRSEKSKVEKENKFPHKKARYEEKWNRGENISNGEKPRQFQSLNSKPKGNFVKKGVP